MLTVKPLRRLFVINGKKCVDPNPTWTIAEVQKFYATQYPDILNCELGEPEMKNELLTFTFTKTVAVKG